MSANVESLLKAALDPGTGSKELKKIWGQTTSTRVRKAIAGNPNSDTETLAIAARLYIKEVINNPSFEILKVFTEDKVVGEMYDAYMDPQAYSKRRSHYQIRDESLKGNLAKAMLVSPHLRSSLVWDQFIFPSLTSQEITRELKDGEVRKNLGKVVRIGLSDQSSYRGFLFLYNLGVISKDDTSTFLGTLRPKSYYSSRRDYLTGFYDFLKLKDYPLLFKYVSANNENCLKHLVKEIGDGKFQINSENLPYFVSLYRDFLRVESEILSLKCEKYKTRYGIPILRKFDDSFHSHYLSAILWHYICCESRIKETCTEDLDLNALFNIIKECGFDKDYGPYPSEINFVPLNVVTDKNILCKKLLELKDDYVFEFFMTCGMLWTDWYAKSKPSNLESEIIERMHSINYTKEMKYYNFSRLDIFPTVSIENYPGLEYNRDFYNVSVKKFPPGSGNLDPAIITHYVTTART